MEKVKEAKIEKISYSQETMQRIFDLLNMIPVMEYNATMAKAEIYRSLRQDAISE